MATIQYYEDNKTARLFDKGFVVDILEVDGKEVLKSNTSRALRQIHYKITGKWIKTEFGWQNTAHIDNNSIFFS